MTVAATYPRTAWQEWLFRLRLWAARLAVSGLWPARWVQPQLPTERPGRSGRLHIELVSHCWNYSHLLVYQLSGLVLYPPRAAEVTLTVFYAEEDATTTALLQAFAARSVPGVHWNFQALPKSHLFRRAIGRNQAALTTRADWIWFTDCDLVCHEGCLDGLAAALQGRTDALVYPQHESITPLLAEGDALLRPSTDGTPLDIDATQFARHTLSRATGPMQIVHGDVARQCGYCPQLPVYQEPMPHFAKCYEDRAYRWLLGTQGVPVTVPAVFRIRHQAKGRYTGKTSGRLRLGVRQLQERGRALMRKLRGSA